MSTASDQSWRAYRSELVRFVRGRVRDSDLAEDIVQEVMIRAHAQQDQLREPGKMMPWLYQITRNALVDHYRAQRPMDELPEDLAGGEHDRSEQVEQALAGCLRPLVDQLPDRYREALRLADLEEVPQAEIARRLGISLSGAKSRVQRARQLLKGILLDCCRIEVDHKGRFSDYERKRKAVPDSSCGSC